MDDASRRGAANRRRGHSAERAVAAWLRENGYPDASTTRARLGHDGTRQPGDVEAIPGLVISVKDVAKSAWPTWAVQAHDEARGKPWIVVRRTRGVADPGGWDCLYSHNLFEGETRAIDCLQTLSNFVAWWESGDDEEETP